MRRDQIAPATVAALLATMVLASAAHADSFGFQFSTIGTAGGTGKISGVGTLLTDAGDGAGHYRVLNADGSITVGSKKYTIVGTSQATDPRNSLPIIADNTLDYPSSPYFTYLGVSLRASDGTVFNLYADIDDSLYAHSSVQRIGSFDTQIAVTINPKTVATPGPVAGTGAAALFAVAGLGLLRQRRPHATA